jgi:TrmH family RNA methyltransferase
VLTRREERLLRTLRQRRTREAEGLFVAEGLRAVEDLVGSSLALRFGVAASTVEDNERGRALLGVLRRRGVPVHEVGGGALRDFADTDTPQGLLVVAEIPERGLDSIDTTRDPAVILVLDAVQDPGNFGSLVRTAEALGAAGVVSLPGTVDAWNPKAVRGAMGSSFRLPVVEAGWDALAPWLEARGITPVAAVVGAPPIAGLRRTALVLGNEGAGVSPETLLHARLHAGIPLRGRAESLNVAAAGAILLHEVLR